MEFNLLHELISPNTTKIVMVIMDGLGGLPLKSGGKTELESAATPNLDALAARSALGLTLPVQYGVTAGSGPGHLAIFGYDPEKYVIGRGAMEALGVDIELGVDDVAARGNFCCVDENEILIDRRAGRLPTEQSRVLVDGLNEIKVEGTEFFARIVKEHRFALVMRGHHLGDGLTETDPLKNGCPPLQVCATRPDSETTRQIFE